MTDGKPRYVTTGELADKLQSLRWEMRFLIALTAIGNLGIAKTLRVPGASEAVNFIGSLVM